MKDFMEGIKVIVALILVGVFALCCLLLASSPLIFAVGIVWAAVHFIHKFW